VQTGRIYFCFSGTFSNNTVNGGMNIELHRAAWQYKANFGDQFFGAVVSVTPQFRNIAPNRRTEFQLEFVDQQGSGGGGSTSLVDVDWCYDLVVYVYPAGSLVQLYDLEWVMMEI
jgi:hypothetical protein